MPAYDASTDLSAALEGAARVYREQEEHFAAQAVPHYSAPVAGCTECGQLHGEASVRRHVVESTMLGATDALHKQSGRDPFPVSPPPEWFDAPFHRVPAREAHNDPLWGGSLFGMVPPPPTSVNTACYWGDADEVWNQANQACVSQQPKVFPADCEGLDAGLQDVRIDTFAHVGDWSFNEIFPAEAIQLVKAAHWLLEQNEDIVRWVSCVVSHHLDHLRDPLREGGDPREPFTGCRQPGQLIGDKGCNTTGVSLVEPGDPCFVWPDPPSSMFTNCMVNSVYPQFSQPRHVFAKWGYRDIDLGPAGTDSCGYERTCLADGTIATGDRCDGTVLWCMRPQQTMRGTWLARWLDCDPREDLTKPCDQRHEGTLASEETRFCLAARVAITILHEHVHRCYFQHYCPDHHPAYEGPCSGMNMLTNSFLWALGQRYGPCLTEQECCSRIGSTGDRLFMYGGRFRDGGC